jgi:ER lumen protein retaining receptor
MLHVYRLLGDLLHAASIVLFLVIAAIKGNGSGISLKTHLLYLLTFLTRYLDLLTTFYSLYNTCMKVFFIVSTILIIVTLTKIEPAKSTYSPSMDNFNHWNLIIFAGLFSMVIHLVGSGVVDIKGSSGQEFEVHFEHYSWMSFLWTFSICLEPLAMIPQLYIFLRHRLMNRDIRVAIFLMGTYRLLYVIFWIFRAYKQDNFRHHILLYASGIVQVLTYADFFLYHYR